MRWYPIVTFWQVSADMTNAASVPGGHGHNYGDSVLDGWAAVAPPDGWTADDTERIRVALEKSASADGPEYQCVPRIRQAQALTLAAALVGWGSRSNHGCPDRSVPVQAGIGTALAVITRAPLGLRRPRCGRGCGWG